MKNLFVRLIYKECGVIKEDYKIVHWDKPICSQASIAELRMYIEISFGIEVVSIVNFRRMEDAE